MWEIQAFEIYGIYYDIKGVRRYLAALFLGMLAFRRMATGGAVASAQSVPLLGALNHCGGVVIVRIPLLKWGYTRLPTFAERPLNIVKETVKMLPIFPLKLVVFPGERVNLHIFEDRYKQLIQESEAAQRSFGMPIHINDKLMDVGTELALVAVRKRYEDGRMDITCEGRRRFKVLEVHNPLAGKLYAGAEVEWLAAGDRLGDVTQNVAILRLMKRLFQLLRIDKPLPSQPTDLQMYDIGHLVGLSVQQEYHLLTLDSELARQQFVRAHLESLIPTIEEMEQLKERVQLNGHFKNVLPPKF